MSQSTITAWATAATLPLLLIQTMQLGFTRKRGYKHGDLQLCTKEREPSSHGLNISP